MDRPPGTVRSRVASGVAKLRARRAAGRQSGTNNTPRDAAAHVVAGGTGPHGRRAALLQELDGQMRRVAEAPVRAAAHDAVAAQIVLDTLPSPSDVPPAVCLPRSSRHVSVLPRLAQLRHNRLRMPSQAQLALQARRCLRPGVRDMDTSLAAVRAQLRTACEQAERTAHQIGCSVATGADMGFHSAWVAFRKESVAYAKRIAKRAPMVAASPAARPVRLTAAARVRAGTEARLQRAAAAASATILSAQPVLDRAAVLVRVHGATRAACAAAASAVMRARAFVSAESFPTRPHTVRARVLATVVRSRPVVAMPVDGSPARGCVRPRPDAVRGAAGRPVVKAARVGETVDTIRTIVAAQCGGGKSGCDGSGAETRSGARFCP